MPTPVLTPCSRGCERTTARATKNMTTEHAMRLVTRRAFLARATTNLDHEMTFSKLNATSMKGIETPAETDTT